MRPWDAILASALAAGCAPDPSDPSDPAGRADPEPSPAAGVRITDLGASSGYQDFFFGTYKHGRGAVVADFDGDGDPDLFSGNPGSRSFLIRNQSTEGELRFEPWQVLSEDELFYGGVAVDFDNDGDPDLFVATGANDGFEADRLFRNDRDRGAPDEAPLVDVSDTLDLVPVAPDGTPVPNGSMGARAADFDRDGWTDLWVSNFGLGPGEGPASEVLGLNQLYLNQGGLELVDRAWELGLRYQGGSRHAAVFDYDRDGDPDIYENNYRGRSVLWQNRLVEEGALRFENVTEAATLGPTSLAGPVLDQVMCAIPVDLDNDGWEDLLVLNRGRDDPGAVGYHMVFMNVEGRGFYDVGDRSDLSVGFDEHLDATSTGAMGTGWGVMGCQVGDVDLDGFPDVFLGTGVGAVGGVNRLLVSRERESLTVAGVGEIAVPMFDDWTDRLDFPVDPVPGAPEVPYPYRTHGTAFADYDGDGIPELGVHNGGPAHLDHLEPNRLWVFDHPDPRFLRVTVVGGGPVPRDATGTRVRVTVERDRDGARWDLFQVVHLGSGFGAQNEAALLFGLGDGDRATAVGITWPDGLEEEIPPPDGLRATLHVARQVL